MERVLAFGTFDPLHEGHIYFLDQARALGDHLTVVVARDSVIQTHKERSPHSPENQRLFDVQQLACVDEALLGDEDPSSYSLLSALDFSLLALGYDQEPSDVDVRDILSRIQKKHVRVVRLQGHMTDVYKSSLLRG